MKVWKADRYFRIKQRLLGMRPVTAYWTAWERAQQRLEALVADDAVLTTLVEFLSRQPPVEPSHDILFRWASIHLGFMALHEVLFDKSYKGVRGNLDLDLIENALASADNDQCREALAYLKLRRSKE